MKSLFNGCAECDDGWIREPDGYGCVQWALCSCADRIKRKDGGHDRDRGRCDDASHDVGALSEL